MQQQDRNFDLLRCEAEDLYVEDGLTHEEIAGRLDLSLSTVQKWSAADSWKKTRADHQARKRALRQNLTTLRDKLLSKAVKDPEPQTVHAVINLEKLALARRAKAGDGEAAEVDRPKIFLENMEFLAEILKEIDPEGLKVLGRNFDKIIKCYKQKISESQR